MFRNAIKYLFKTKVTKKSFDFSIFLPKAPQTHKQQLLEECTKRGIPIHVDNSLEQSSGAYSIFRNPASEAELENRLSTKKAIILSKRVNFIAFLALIVSAIPLIRPFL
ncbi:MAG TPA: hypothetical protein DE312_11175 [Gallionella sp.]|nr:MAG: hypothetical protein A2Z87_00760 [Gallionellales bacterium GWA2_54_124]OGT19416.1 MAG: hypothetical protein A2522_02780 [Gallionellales bacterium RIFOXYD12_FULL_53_10]HCI53854.1 hypothetical protein [Gallionella sp.]